MHEVQRCVTQSDAHDGSHHVADLVVEEGPRPRDNGHVHRALRGKEGRARFLDDVQRVEYANWGKAAPWRPETGEVVLALQQRCRLTHTLRVQRPPQA